MFNPKIVISDVLGAELTTSQDTPVATKKENKCIVFNEEVHIQKSLESLPSGRVISKLNIYTDRDKLKIHVHFYHSLIDSLDMNVVLCTRFMNFNSYTVKV